MRRISSTATSLFQWIPVALFALLGCLVAGTNVAAMNGRVPFGLVLIILVQSSIIGGVIYVIAKVLVWPLADEVSIDDEHDELIARKRGVEVRVPIREIINVDSTVLMNPERITLLLEQPTALGREIVFTPPLLLSRGLSMKRHPIATELIARARGVDDL
ncbi:hypothetical protein [Planctomicrobium sp. SH664]|uniref:hypothetical protein n=1 Tax=Planctomicrobium sp. SH664 TaxID=3448125 RepID=UPI003F5B8A13